MEDRLTELKNLGGVGDRNEKSTKDKKSKKSKDKDVNTNKENSNRNNNNNNNNNNTNGEEFVDIELGPLNEEDKFMPEFYKDVGIVKLQMTSIRRVIKEIQEKYIISLNTFIDHGNKHEEEIQRMINSTNSSFLTLKKKLEEMKSSTDKYISQKEGTDTEERIRVNMQKTLTLKFVDLMKEYQEIQNNYKNKYQEKLERQYLIVKPNATKEELQKVIEGGSDSQQIFAETILYENLHKEAQNALAYVKNRHNDIVLLERSIAELHQLFMDMSVLVDAQGEILNVIEINVDSTVGLTKEGVDNLQIANKHHRKGRRKMYILLVLVVIVLLAVLLPTLLTLL
ncbi:t-SNARE family protein [Tieghemostelium lacteum]|uniref:t-SNARE family protein n=1 Tax=Tieghemostelium lacteum TaxID=361077 RepID=A0A151ZBE5_TIELA|nr:t-SNARE family protein [Tieghemostelium lacteum]|eukprot:KYQ91273.1 t-SNARE family protein [Tieghemostelium lacteum]